MLRKVDKPWRQDLAVGDNDDQVRLQSFNQGVGFTVFQRFRLVYGEVQLHSLLFDRRSLHVLSPPAGFIGLCDDTGYFTAVFEQALKCRDREWSASHENRVHFEIRSSKFEFL